MALEWVELLTPVDSPAGRLALRERLELLGARDHAADVVDGVPHLVERIAIDVDVVNASGHGRSSTSTNDEAIARRMGEFARAARAARAAGVPAADVTRAMAIAVGAIRGVGAREARDRMADLGRRMTSTPASRAAAVAATGYRPPATFTVEAHRDGRIVTRPGE